MTWTLVAILAWAAMPNITGEFYVSGFASRAQCEAFLLGMELEGAATDGQPGDYDVAGRCVAETGT